MFDTLTVEEFDHLDDALWNGYRAAVETYGKDAEITYELWQSYFNFATDRMAPAV